MQKNICMK